MNFERPFSCAHRYAHPAWSEEQNEAAYGSDYSAEPMGHNILWRWKFSGSEELAAKCFNSIFAAVDHKYLNRDLKFFHTQPVTPEMLCQLLLNELESQMPGATRELNLSFGQYLGVSYCDDKIWRRQSFRLQTGYWDLFMEAELSGPLNEDGQVISRDGFGQKMAPLLAELSGQIFLDKNELEKKWQSLLEKLFQPLGFLVVGRISKTRVEPARVI